MLIGNIKINGIAVLAPMAGVTDRAFREICSIFGASALSSEMISVKGLIYHDKKTLQLLSDRKNDHKNNALHSVSTQSSPPFIIQLFGYAPDDFSEATKIVSEFGCDIIDINMGCPAPKIIKSGAGSYLMKNPELCGKIVDAVKRSSKVPVTVKIRAGLDRYHKNAVEVAKQCEFYGADAVTIHGRTKEQMYSGEVDLEIIKNVVENVDIPVIGNGDITSYQKAKYMIDYTGCKMVSVGRGALGNPWIFKSINLNKDISPVTIDEKIKVMKLHIEKLILYKTETIAMKEARKHLAWYVKGIKGAAVLRKHIFEMKNIEDFNVICDILLKIN